MSSSSKHTKEFESYDRLVSALDNGTLSALDNGPLAALDKDEPHIADIHHSLNKNEPHFSDINYYQGVMLHCEMSIPILGDLVNIIVDYLSYEKE